MYTNKLANVLLSHEKGIIYDLIVYISNKVLNYIYIWRLAFSFRFSLTQPHETARAAYIFQSGRRVCCRARQRIKSLSVPTAADHSASIEKTWPLVRLQPLVFHLYRIFCTTIRWINYTIFNSTPRDGSSAADWKINFQRSEISN